LLTLAFGPALAGYPLLTHFPRPGEEVVHLGALEFHTALAFETGMFLVVFGAMVQGVAHPGAGRALRIDRERP
jgi:hypothetical protein